jgi:hypothetical protein
MHVSRVASVWQPTTRQIGWGFPLRISIDYNPMTAGDEVIHILTDFKAR